MSKFWLLGSVRRGYGCWGRSTSVFLSRGTGIVGVMLVFPNWLKHQVMPFFGEGERRSIAMNWNVNDSEEERKKYMSDRESKLYDAKKKSNEC